MAGTRHPVYPVLVIAGGLGYLAWLAAGVLLREHPCHGFRRAWAPLRLDEGRPINRKKVHRLWTEEGLQRKIRSARKRVGLSSVPAFIDADAPKVVCGPSISKDEHNSRHRHSSLGYLTPHEYAAQCGHTHTPEACEID